MATRISRTKLAAYVADSLVAGDSAQQALQHVAAYLVDTRRTREWELIARDIEAALAKRGITVADVTTAWPLDATARTQVQGLVGAKKLHLRETVDSSVLGGVLIHLPGQRFDGTVRRKLTALKLSTVKEHYA